MQNKFTITQKKKIFKNIQNNGYAVLHNIYSKKRINGVKNSLLSMLNYIKPGDITTNLQKKNIRSKSRVCIINTFGYGSWLDPNKKKNFAKFVMTDRFCPLIKLPYLKNEKAPLFIPYMFEGENKVDYNATTD